MKISFQWIGGATVILEIGKMRIAMDPCLAPKGTIQDYFWFKSKRIEDPIYNDTDFDSIDLWLITHNHEDHIDKTGLSKIKEDTLVVSNSNAQKLLKSAGKNNILTLPWKQKMSITTKEISLTVESIPAIHGINPLSALFAGKVNGYLMTITYKREKKTIYFTSDTVYKSKVIKTLQGRKINLMVPNMGAAKQGSWIMTLTLNAIMLKKMLKVLNPEMVIPIHYGTFEHYTEPIEKTLELEDSRIKTLTVGSKVTLQL